jgi:multidrug resistance efflux pump
MEERIQRKLEELTLERRLNKFSFGLKTTKQDLREEAVRKVEEDIQKEEELKQKIQIQREEYQKSQERMQQEHAKRHREKQEEEAREKQQLLQNKENPDMPLTLKDLREIKGFDYDAYRRAYDELNVEMLKRIAREQYPHKFKRPYENQ